MDTQIDHAVFRTAEAKALAEVVGRVMAGTLQPGPHPALREVAEVQLRLRRGGADPTATPLTAATPEAGQMEAWTCGACPTRLLIGCTMWSRTRGFSGLASV